MVRLGNMLVAVEGYGVHGFEPAQKHLVPSPYQVAEAQQRIVKTAPQEAKVRRLRRS